MATSNERRALWFLAIVALSGAVVRMVRAREAPTARDAGIDGQLARVDSARSSPKRVKAPATKPAGPTSAVVDIDFATADQIEALPGIGPSLAARIVAYRDSTGGFRSLSAFCQVPGVGPSLAKRVRGSVQFSGIQDPNGSCETPRSESARSQVTKGKKRGAKAS